jgi:hypothetical protein
MKYLKVLFMALVISLLSTNVTAEEESQDGPKLIIANLTNGILDRPSVFRPNTW